MEDLNSLKLVELKGRAEAAGIEKWKTMSKAQIIAALQPNPQGPPEEEELPKPQYIPETDGKVWAYDSVNNRYKLVNSPSVVQTSRRYFDQKANLYTDETHHAPLTRAYNLEHTIPITDSIERIGAKERGQDLGDASAGIHLKDEPPENPD